MENGAFWKQLSLPVVFALIFVSIATVAGMLLYSESKGIVFRIWGQDFGAVKNAPNVDSALQGKIVSLESRLAVLEKEKQLQAVKPPEVVVAKPINKVRVLDVGQALNESTLPFSVYVKSGSGGDGYANFLIEIQTPESPLYSAEVTKGWSRSFEVGSREFNFSVVDIDKRLATITVSLKEVSARR
ncbi:hypothetical protein [Pseudomonas koreensis]|uniref:Transmembrane protein n=1 Tax=Pseudomonas koreensis TaxID=198620 RepID=A0A9X3BEF4_9PSED|nr:hypothetical protein [Pseudomonas koreensis]MCU7251690.1 hypothetical protein [Pseudomonas koreensis]